VLQYNTIQGGAGQYIEGQSASFKQNISRARLLSLVLAVEIKMSAPIIPAVESWRGMPKCKDPTSSAKTQDAMSRQAILTAI
jgi:hypothetical protein